MLEGKGQGSSSCLPTWPILPFLAGGPLWLAYRLEA